MNNNQYSINDILTGNPVDIAMQEPVPSFPDAGGGSSGVDTLVADLISQGDIVIGGEGVSIPSDTFIPDISNEEISHDIVFSAPSAVRAAWTAGTISTSGGLSYSISAGNTTAALGGTPMSGNVIIYFDIDTPTILKVTSSPSLTVGVGKTILATAKPGSSSAIVQVTSGIGGLVIDEDVMFVTNLAAINADMGAITAGTITLDSSGYIRGGQTSYDTGPAGFYLGYSAGAYKLAIGDPTGNKLTWDGSGLTVSGDITAMTGRIGGDDGWVVSPGYIKDVAGTSGLSSVVTGGNDIRFWAGSTNPALAPFRVYENGNVVANNLSLSGYLQTGDAENDVKNTLSRLSDLDSDLGSITAGTITGALIRTSSSGSRVQLNDSTNTLQIFDSSGNVRAESYANGWEFSTESEVTAGRIFIESTFNNLQIQAVSSNLLLTAIGDVLFAPDNGSIQGYFDSRGLHLNDDLDMNGNDIDMEGGEIDACGDITMDGNNNDIENVDRIEGLAGYIDFGFSSYFSVENDFLPQSDDSYDLGSSSTAWEDTYTYDLYYDSLKSLSDRRLKKNIVSVKTGLASILSLNPISFNYKEKDTELKPDRKEKKNKGKNMKDFPERQAKFLEKRKARSEKLHYGFIAQEVQEVFPELVQKNKDNDMLNLNTTEVIPFLVKAVQELSAEVEALKK